MSLPDPPSQRQLSSGDAEREHPIFDQQPIGPWRGRVTVTPIARLGGRAGETRFEVAARWTGPGLPDLPPSPVDVEAEDVYWTGDPRLAKAIAELAIEELRAPRLPDLRELSRRARRRRDV